MKIAQNGDKEKFILSDMENEYNAPSLHVERPVYSYESLNRNTRYKRGSNLNISSFFKKKCQRFRALSLLYNIIPILKWLPEYSWKKNFAKDVISGLTVAVMHIPQGMAYGLLGNVPPIIGIYMAFFPVLIYVIFGTSRHVSMGTFAVVCLMTGKVVAEHSTVDILQNGTEVEHQGLAADAPRYTNVEVAVTVTFVVAIIQLGMYVLRLGAISALLSDTLVNGFTCACAFHVVASQLKDLLGLPIKKRRGLFSFLLAIYDSALSLPKANLAAVTVSVITMSILVFNDKIIKPRLKKKTIIPLPIELVAVSFGTLASYLMKLDTEYNMSVVGLIPTGLPIPSPPRLDLIQDVFIDSLVITMVSYSITVSMGLIFARMLRYEIDFNQELLALGLSNTVGSFFSAMPITASLSRSMIQQAVGGVTQLASVVSCAILLLILLWIGPVFQLLPRCVLASIIIVALWSMVMKVTMLPKYWKLSRWDAFVWLGTFCVTIFVDISYGLAAGLLIAIYSLFKQGYNPYNCVLGVVPNTDIYLDVKRRKGVREIEGIRIFHFTGAINFASQNAFKNALYKRIGFDPSARSMLLEEEEEEYTISDNSRVPEEDQLDLKSVILDFSAITFVDPTGVNVLSMIQKNLQNCGINLYFAACLDPVYEMLKRCCQSGETLDFKIFPTIHDAVLHIQHKVLVK